MEMVMEMEMEMEMEPTSQVLHSRKLIKYHIELIFDHGVFLGVSEVCESASGTLPFHINAFRCRSSRKGTIPTAVLLIHENIEFLILREFIQFCFGCCHCDI